MKIDSRTIKKIGKKIGNHSSIQSIVRIAVTFCWSRKILNSLYLRLTPYQRSVFHGLFAKIFRDKSYQVRNGVWKIEFQGKTIALPLDSEQIWLKWDSAVSIVGHDINVKETYRYLLNLPNKPDLFIDIGANYGTHSLLFLVHGINTLTFEPNSSCHIFFKNLCELNGVQPNLQPIALGETDSHVELSYPIHDTWLGSTDKEVINKLATSHELVTERVVQKKLDDYMGHLVNKDTLIKIDTEGNELFVLRGSTKILQHVKPKVIFESWNADDRIALFEFFNLHSYQIYSLPMTSSNAEQVLDYDQFVNSTSDNFIAIPK
ncbi:MAG: FkbM family methyltransferase [Pseudanabaenaceae cyanobacterium bins.39]|nr:FkbM family methyltransferase [Pseudanabaenaceae cyanobacterium bins.39]